MTRRQKLYQRILKKPKDLRFEEVEKVLQYFGYSLNRIHGDHYIYTKPGYPPLTIPHQQPVKSYLIDQVLEVISELIDDEG